MGLACQLRIRVWEESGLSSYSIITDAYNLSEELKIYINHGAREKKSSTALACEH